MTEDNLIRKGIFRGDYLLICPQPSVKDALVAIVLNGKICVRYLIQRGDFILLFKDKDDTAPQHVVRGSDDFRLLGKVVSVHRFMAGPLAVYKPQESV